MLHPQGFCPINSDNEFISAVESKNNYLVIEYLNREKYDVSDEAIQTGYMEARSLGYEEIASTIQDLAKERITLSNLITGGMFNALYKYNNPEPNPWLEIVGGLFNSIISAYKAKRVIEAQEAGFTAQATSPESSNNKARY